MPPITNPPVLAQLMQNVSQQHSMHENTGEERERKRERVCVFPYHE